MTDKLKPTPIFGDDTTLEFMYYNLFYYSDIAKATLRELIEHQDNVLVIVNNDIYEIVNDGELLVQPLIDGGSVVAQPDLEQVYEYVEKPKKPDLPAMMLYSSRATNYEGRTTGQLSK